MFLLFDMKTTPVALGLIFLALSGCSTAIAGDEAKAKPALEAAHRWLKLIDAGDFNGAFDAGASYFRVEVAREGWIAAGTQVRSPLGSLIKRKLKSTTFGNTLLGLPGVDYVIIQFESSFEHRSSVIETITPILDKDGSWRVSGYYIK